MKTSHLITTGRSYRLGHTRILTEPTDNTNTMTVIILPANHKPEPDPATIIDGHQVDTTDRVNIDQIAANQPEESDPAVSVEPYDHGGVALSF
jgi:hypothetical protein